MKEIHIVIDKIPLLKMNFYAAPINTSTHFNQVKGPKGTLYTHKGNHIHVNFEAFKEYLPCISS